MLKFISASAECRMQNAAPRKIRPELHGLSPRLSQYGLLLLYELASARGNNNKTNGNALLDRGLSFRLPDLQSLSSVCTHGGGGKAN